MVIFPTGVQGLSDTKWQGAQGQVHRIAGIDYQSKPGIIKVQQKLTKDSGVIIDELCKVSVPVSDGSTLWFSSESGKIWREVAGVYTLINTTLIDIGRINSAEYTSKSYNYSAQISIPTAHCFSNDGLKMYVMGNATVSGNSGEIFQYTLTTPWDVTTATYSTKKFNADINGYGLAIKTDGTKIYVTEDGGTESVIEYNLSTAWDISTATATGNTFSYAADGGRGCGIQFKPDGLKMYIWDWDTYEINQYTLSSAWNITTASFTSTFDLPTFISAGFINPDGTKMFLSQSTSGGIVKEYSFGTAWDVTTLVDTGRTFAQGNSRYFGIGHAVDTATNTLYFYMGTQTAETVYQYSINIEPDTNVIALSAEEFSVPAEDAAEDAEPTPYVYFTTKNRILRIAVASIATPWNNQQDIIAKFKYGDDTYHPIKKQNNRLFIGDKYVIAEIQESGLVVLETDFNLLAPERITTLGIIDTDLLVGSKEPRRAWVKRWDTEALSWYAQDSVEETEIYAFLTDDNDVYVIAGDFGKLYYYDGEKMYPEVRVPGEYSKTERIKVNHNAVANFFGIPVFGVSNLEGNAAWQGVYSYGRFSKDYNVTLNLPFPLSCDSFDNIEIGSILVQGYDLMVSWKSATDVGVDRIDWTAKYESAFIETTVLLSAKDRSKFKSIDNIVADYYKLPTDTSLEFSVENNYQGFNDIEPEQKVNEKLYQIQAKATQKELGAIAVMFEFNVNGNDSPEIENFHVNFPGE